MVMAVNSFGVCVFMCVCVCVCRGIVKASGEVSSKGEKKKSSSISKGRAAAQWLSMLGSLMFFMWLLCRYQTEVLPWPVSEKAAGVRGFSEQRALRHVKVLTAFGPHPVGSQPLHSAVQVPCLTLTWVGFSSHFRFRVGITSYMGSRAKEIGFVVTEAISGDCFENGLHVKFRHCMQLGDPLQYRFVVGSPVEIVSTSTPLPCQKDPEKC